MNQTGTIPRELEDKVKYELESGDLTDIGSPHPWQTELGENPVIGNRLIRTPTGFSSPLWIDATRGIYYNRYHKAEVVIMSPPWRNRIWLPQNCS